VRRSAPGRRVCLRVELSFISTQIVRVDKRSAYDAMLPNPRGPRRGPPRPGRHLAQRALEAARYDHEKRSAASLPRRSDRESPQSLDKPMASVVDRSDVRTSRTAAHRQGSSAAAFFRAAGKELAERDVFLDPLRLVQKKPRRTRRTQRNIFSAIFAPSAVPSCS
jgi:hypothetical protein